MSSSNRREIEALIQKEISRLHNFSNFSFETMIQNVKQKFNIGYLESIDETFIENEYSQSLLKHWLECSLKGYAQYIRSKLSYTPTVDLVETLNDEKKRLIHPFIECVEEKWLDKWLCQPAHQLIQNEQHVFKKPSARKFEYFKSLSECCHLLLSAQFDPVVHEKDNHRVIQLCGISITCSQVMEALVQQKLKYPNVEELHIFCGSHLIIDCDLEQTFWHGTNIVISTDKLFVDRDVCWDVSGNGNSHKYESAAENASSTEQDGKAGKWTIHFHKYKKEKKLPQFLI